MSDLSEGRDALEQLDQRVRRLGVTLAELSWNEALHLLADEIPDARARLSHVGQLTEDAAHKVLNMVDAAQPVCQSAAADAEALAGRLASVADHPEVGVGEARAALAEAVEALRHHGGVVRGQSGVLTDIMLAQDFQDLSGQMIKKVVAIISHTEQQLHRLLAQTGSRLVGGPLRARLAEPQVPDQADVDALLAAVGF
ncbi:MAG: protein phosphatase CheZ [Microbacteriaceae bacterium]|nr:protein phosphatase CheZ [Burkholderiaceae bacterium]